MRPEQALANAADVLDEARKVHFDPDRSGALVVVAEGWTRLYEALVHTATFSEPPTERPAVVQLAPDHSEMASVYRERAALVAYLAAAYPSAIVHDADPSAPGWPIVFVNTPQGQMSWHLAAEDLSLFDHVVKYMHPDVEGAPKWDGHTTAEKYARLAAAVQALHTDGRFPLS